MIATIGKLHTTSGEWLSLFLALVKFAVRRPKTRWMITIDAIKMILSSGPHFNDL
jgi:hypothetical protein